MTDKNLISKGKATLIFIVATLWFYCLLFTLLPWMKSQFILNSALYWFILGFFIFVPLFVYAVIAVKAEGNRHGSQMKTALSLRKLTRKDWTYTIVGLIAVFIGTGFIYGGSFLLTKTTGIRPLNTTPWFMEMRPFQGSEKFLLLIWLPMFFFNIAGEEILWRGYIQSRLQGKNTWLLCSLLWIIFHLPFGVDLMIMLLPIMFIVPYAFHKTHNTWVGILIHGIYNGPIFIAVALGFMK